MKKSIISKNINKITKKTFAGGSSHNIDYNLKKFDVIFVGGLNAANTIKYMQHTGFHGTMAGFNNKPRFYNEHHYELFVHGTIPSFKYMSSVFSSNFESKASCYFPHRITKIDPKNNKVVDDRGIEFSYKSLVLNTGLDHSYKNMPFLEKYLKDGELGKSRVFVHNPSDDDHIERNRRIISMHKDNDLIVYLPKLPSRREAYDAWYLKLDTYLSWGLQSGAHPKSMKIRVITPNKNLFNFPFANEVVMDEISQRSMIETHFGWELVNVEVVEKPNATLRYATFKNEKGEEMRMPFGTLVLTPNNKKREIYNGNDLADEHGQVTVNPYTLQHKKYDNVFAFGDCADVPTTKSLYATLNQQVVLRNNLTDYLHGREFSGVYEGYSSFAVNHSLDRQYVFSHKYGYEPSFGNFYSPRYLGFMTYMLKAKLEKQYFSKIYQSKPNFGYPYLQKNRYFLPLDENKYMKQKGLKKEDIMIHPIRKPELSTDHHDDHSHEHHAEGHKVKPAH